MTTKHKKAKALESASLPVIAAGPLPSETEECLAKLLNDARRGEVIGVAVVAILSDRGYVAYTRGEARTNRTFTTGALHIFSSRLALESVDPSA
jgi:hypothetical protein